MPEEIIPSYASKPLKIYFVPDAVLYEKSKEVEVFDEKLKELLADMCENIHQFNGVGLAANQIGLPIRAFVVDSDNCLKEGEANQHGGKPLKMVNPIITAKSDEKYEPEEGCMSLPSISAKVVRHRWIDVEYFDESGKKQKIEKADGLLGQCIQHENDHIDGIVITHYSSSLKRDFLTKKVEKYVKFHEVYKYDEIRDARVIYNQFT